MRPPLSLVLTPGQTQNIQGFGLLFCIVPYKIEALRAAKGYDADLICEKIANVEIEAVIPSKDNSRNPIPPDRAKYHWRNLVERLFSKFESR